MAVLEWHEGLNVGVGFMDDDHAEAAALINRLAEVGGEDRVATLRHFIDHCREHFAREEEMMKATGFFAHGCHAGEHERMLGELADVLARIEGGQVLDDYFRRELPAWLMNHRNTMDFVTAQFARQAGYQAA
ncbi:MAG: hemerythrin domain-containing protein [Pseudomonadota bacterium]